ncbi:MAG: NADH-quinone oxidoreductase subunit NuoF [Spirochaetaceae bacterium]|nr:MAG: NADH-quinone oxidoreductase subunit NuoF [Spirochaetaceae bacterium]
MTSGSIRTKDDLDRFRDEERARMAGRKLGFLVCGGAGCIASGAERIAASLKEELPRAGVEVTTTGCMGPCAKGPLVTVIPSGRLYHSVRVEDVADIVAQAVADSADQATATDGARAGTPAEAALGELSSFFELQKRIVLRNCGRIDPEQIGEYIGAGGYQALATVLGMTGEQIIDEMKRSGLRGRGGAGFPTWLKWQLTQQSPGEEKYVLCNADEGDPGAFMDRSVLEGDPHAVIEGMAIAARAIGARRGYVYVRAEYPLAVERLQGALDAARGIGLLGTDVLGTGFDFDLEIRKGSGAFVCGEETALMNSIEGKRGEPRPRPPFPAQKGLWGKPSLLNNVETYANVPVIFTEGSAWYAAHGTPESRGTKVFALAGSIENAGLVEVPIGTPLGEIIYDIGGGVKGGHSFKAAQIGGPSGGCVPKQHLNVPLDYSTLQELGAIMGSGGLVVMDDETCMVDVARFFLEFVQEESCGKCVPCRVGTKRMLEILTRISSGQGREGDIELLEELGNQIKQTALCGLGQTAANPVLSTIRHFRHEYEAHIRDHHCEAGVCPALVRAPCQSACPANVDVPGFVALIRERRYAEALALHRERNPFAAVCARVCFHTCEDHCRRAGIDDPVAIRAIKRFMVDQEVVLQLPEVRENDENATRKIAIVGGGPAGLSCAYFLARLGYQPLVLEAESRPGGMLVQMIPAYRLPRETVAREIRMIEQLGVEIRTDSRLGRDFTLESLREEGYEAVFVGIGAPDCSGLGVPGEDAKGVIMAGEFLRTYNIRGSVPVGKRVVVIGGGNAAIDAARTAMRLGAETVTVVYRRTQEQMPAYDEEIAEAKSEGVEIRALTQPTEVVVANGVATGLACVKMALGEFDRSGRRRPQQSEDDSFVLDADQIIVAIGQELDTSFAGALGLELNAGGFIAANPVTGQTSVAWIFSGGDAVLGPASVVEAIGAGERAAVGIDLMLTGEAHAFWREQSTVETDFDPNADPAPYPRDALKTIPVERRRNNFDEVEHAWNESVTIRQASRCLRCEYGKKPQPPVVPTKEELHV